MSYFFVQPLFNMPPQWFFIVSFLICIIALLWLLIYQFIHITTSEEQYVESFQNHTEDGIPTKDELVQYETSTYRSAVDIYDNYYVSVYQRLIDDYKESLVTYEVNDLIKQTRLKEYGSQAVIADIGCGTGQHMRKIQAARTFAKLYGIDISPLMLDACPKHQKVRLINTSFDNYNSLDSNFFTHITCYYFSFYYSKDYKALLRNVYSWLADGGYFCVHLVDIDKFDPIIDAANPFIGISLQKYMKKRAKTSFVVMNNCTYSSTFAHKKGNPVATFRERFIYKERKIIRENIHKLHLPNH